MTMYYRAAGRVMSINSLSEKLATTSSSFLSSSFHRTMRCLCPARCEDLWTWGGAISTQSFALRYRKGRVQVATSL